jgi:hypothetical protein
MPYSHGRGKQHSNNPIMPGQSTVTAQQDENIHFMKQVPHKLSGVFRSPRCLQQLPCLCIQKQLLLIKRR